MPMNRFKKIQFTRLSFVFVVFLSFFTVNLSAQFSECTQVIQAQKAGGKNNDYSVSVAVDAKGNRFITGYFSGTAAFGGDTLTSSGDDDIFISKLDPNGTFLWTKKAGGSASDIAQRITVDHKGNCYVTGRFYATATFGDTKLTASNKSNIFICKLDSSGNFVWTKKAGGEGEDAGRSIAADSLGNIYVTGFFSQKAMFDTIAMPAIPSSYAMFVCKLNGFGDYVWVRLAYGESSGIALAMDKVGNTYVTGEFSKTTVIGNRTLVSQSGIDVFITKLDANGNFIWTKEAGGVGNNAGTGIAIDSSGNCFVTGFYNGTANFGSFSLVPSGRNDIFIAKMDANGSFVWVKSAGGTDDDSGQALAVDARGNAYITGYFVQQAKFGKHTVTGVGNEMFVCKVDNDGHFIWCKSMGGSANDFGFAIALLGNEMAALTGVFHTNTKMDNIVLNGAGVFDAFVMTLSFGILNAEKLSDTTIVCGSDFQLNPKAAHFSKVLWSPANGISDSSRLNPVFSPKQSAYYQLMLTNVCGDTILDSFSATILQPTVFNLSQDTTISCGDSIQLQAELLQPLNPVSFQWQPQYGLNNLNAAQVMAKPGVSTRYSVSAQLSNGCIDKKSVTIQVNNPMPPYFSLRSNTGAFYLCNAALTLVGPLGYQSYWWSDNSDNRNLLVEKTGWFTLIASDTNGCAAIDSVEVFEFDHKIKTPQGNVLCNSLGSNGLSLIAADSMDSYLWSSGEQTQQTQVKTPGIYSVLSFGKGCISRDSVRIEASKIPKVDFSYWHLGFEMHLLAIGADIQEAVWYFGDGDSAIGLAVTHEYQKSGLYDITISATDSCGMTGKLTKKISVNGQSSSVNHRDEDFQISIFPNPNDGLFTLKTNSSDKTEIRIFDVHGKLVLSTQTNQNQINLDLRSLPKGLYIIKAQSVSATLTEHVVLQ